MYKFAYVIQSSMTVHCADFHRTHNCSTTFVNFILNFLPIRWNVSRWCQVRDEETDRYCGLHVTHRSF